MKQVKIAKRDKLIAKELNRMGFGKVYVRNKNGIVSITKQFETSNINVEQLRNYYKKTGNEELQAALESTISFYLLQEQLDKPNRRTWCASFNDASSSVEFLTKGSYAFENTRTDQWFLAVDKHLEKMGFEQYAQEIKVIAVFSKQEAVKKAYSIVNEIKKLLEEPIEKIQRDLQERIELMILEKEKESE